MTPSLSTQPNPPARGSRAVCGIDARTCESGVGGKFSPRFNPAQPTSCCLTSPNPPRAASRPDGPNVVRARASRASKIAVTSARGDVTNV